MSVPKNSHYIPRGLTTPWEHKDRRLCVLDLDKRTLNDHASSKWVFAQEGLFMPEVERWFERVAETPISDWREEVIAGSTSTSSWKKYRAVFLTILFAAPRVAASKDTADTLFKKPMTDPELDVLASAFMAENDIAILPSEFPLYFPETAIFSFPILDTHRQPSARFAFYLPIDPSWCIALVPKGTDLSRLIIGPGFLQNASAGHPEQCRRLLVSPSVKYLGASELLRLADSAQQDNKGIFNAMGELRTLVAEAYSKAGLPAPAWESQPAYRRPPIAR